MLASSESYSEQLSVYLTSGETFWRADLVGGNISVSNVTVPSSVTAYSITLTHYNVWNTQFEVFTKYGFGLLGPFEPMPNASILVVNTTSSSDAASLASLLGLRFGLAFQPYGSTPNSFEFLSPIDFETEMHVYFWNLLPKSYGGFASMMTESQFESSDLNYYKLSYSSSGVYSISIGGLRPLSSASPFKLYNQLGLSQSSFNYSTFASSSSLDIHVLGGIVSNANTTYKFTNNYENFSASFYTSPSSQNHSVPNVNATIDFAFPIILAYRSVSSLTPGSGQNVSATIFIKNISPTNTPSATNLHFNDSWIYDYVNDFKVFGNTGGSNANLSSGQSATFGYTFKVLAPNGTFILPATPVNYSFVSGGKTLNGTVYLNSETMLVGPSASPGSAALEAYLSFNPSSVSSAPFSINVTIINRANVTSVGTAFNVTIAGAAPFNLAAGQSKTVNETASPTSLIQTNATIGFPISWADATGVHATHTNVMSAVFSFATPSSPDLTLEKSIQLFKGDLQGNITLRVLNDGKTSLSALNISDILPSGVEFAKAYNASSLRFSNGMITANVSSLRSGANISLSYLVNLTSKQNFVFSPASVSSVWNNLTVTHYSVGFGLPLGVSATKQVSPSVNFQGSNVTVTINLSNQGGLPIFNVNLSNSQDSFLKILSSSSSYRSVLGSGGTMSASLLANLTGAPGTYNSSTASATFLFAGANQTAASSSFRLTIFHLVEANLSTSSPKIEEAHDIVVTITFSNPSNVTVSDVKYDNVLPSGLKLVSGSEDYNIASLGPNQTITESFVIETNQPFSYSINGGNLTFVYQNHTLKGITSGLVLNIADDIKLRYGVPALIGLVIVVLTLLYVRRLASKSSSSASTKPTKPSQ